MFTVCGRSESGGRSDEFHEAQWFVYFKIFYTMYESIKKKNHLHPSRTQIQGQ